MNLARQRQESLIEQELEGFILHRGRKEEVLSFLYSRGIRSLQEIDDPLVFLFRDAMRCYGDGSMFLSHAVSLERARAWYYREEAKALAEEAEECRLSASVAAKLFPYLAFAGIRHLEEISLTVRESFEAYLTGCHYSRAREMIKALDRLKLFAIRKKEENGIQPVMPGFKKERIFLQYWPCYKNAAILNNVWNKEKLIFDFTLPGSTLVKWQVHAYLCSIMGRDILRTALVEVVIDPLRILYETAMKEGWKDLQMTTLEDEACFRKQVIAFHGTDVQQRYKILQRIRRFLFLSSKEIPWHATIWYLERLCLTPWRSNPALSAETISFAMIRNQDARLLQQQYVRCLLGVTDLSIDTIKRCVYDTRRFLLYCEEKHIDPAAAKEADLHAYFFLLEKDASPRAKHFNMNLYHLKGFYCFLLSHGIIKELPVDFSMYDKKDQPSHHDRFVAEDVRMRTLKSLKYFPEHLRLMYLHLWATGLRIGEVCSLKADNYYERDGTCWLRVRQSKMRMEKSIPIPSVLYGLTKAYIRKMERSPDEFVFQNTKGRAFSYGSFYRTMRETCEELGINNDDYTFRSHDFRHTMASYLYSEGMSLSSIRDFLGHRETEMTKQYIDYIPDIIRKMSDEYFEYHSLTKEKAGI